MSTALRIASVTQVLKDLLNTGLAENDLSGFINGTISITSWAPDKIDTSTGKEIGQLNLFMYQATYNQGWRNIGQPTFNSGGERIANPPLVLDLHYLLSAYGSAELHTDILLACGMLVLHEKTILDKKLIKSIIDNQPPGSSSLKLLSDSAILDQTEQIAVTPELLSIEDISKLWAAFGAKYRPTAAYKVSLVMIQNTRSIKPGLPVKQRNIYVDPFKQPVIDEIAAQVGVNGAIIKDQKIIAGQRLVVLGKELQGDAVQILIDGVAVDPVTGNQVVTNEQISVDLPAGIAAGTHQVQVMQPKLIGTPPVVHAGTTSLPSEFILSPVVQNVSAVNVVVNNGLAKADINLVLNPAINPGQKVMLLLNQVVGSGTTHAYTFPLAADFFGSPPVPVSAITIKVNNVAQGNYLVRIQADGAESTMGSDAQGQYNSPKISM